MTTDAHQSFGQQLAAAHTPAQQFLLDQSEAGTRRAAFRALDQDLAAYVEAALTGNVVLGRKSKSAPLVPQAVPNLAAGHDEQLLVAQQEARGLWTHPEQFRFHYGIFNAGHLLTNHAKWAATIATADQHDVILKNDAFSVAVWGLHGLFEELWLPMKLRSGYWLGSRTPELQEKTWTTIDPLYAALGIDHEVLAPFRFGTRWHDLDELTVTGYRHALAAAWAAVAVDAGERYRVFRIGELVARYYKVARNGRALRSRVLNKSATRTLALYFGGDWTAFLDYLGEQPHESEEIIAELAPVTFLVGTGEKEKTAQVAAQEGVSEADVEAVLAAMFDQPDAESPIERRVAVLKSWWAEFDHLHAVQEPGQESLWGLRAEEQAERFPNPGLRPGDTDTTGADYDEYRSRTLLSSPLREAVDREFGTMQHPKAHGMLVSRQEPTVPLAQALGTAAAFWEGASLTAWFLTQGPYSRTDIPGMRSYYREELKELSEAGCPVPNELFEELQAAEARDGSPAAANRHDDYGLTVTVNIDYEKGTVSTETSRGVRDRSQAPSVSFQTLRDIITRHRRVWAQQHLDRWLTFRWQSDLRDVADKYHRRAADKGKLPTDRQMTTLALPAANVWFGGDVSALATTLTIKAPPIPVRAERLLPADPRGLKLRVFWAMLGPYDHDRQRDKSRPQADRDRESDHFYASWFFGEYAAEVVQLWEANIPGGVEPKHISKANYERAAGRLMTETENAWELYQQVIEDQLTGTDHTRDNAAGRPNPDAGTLTSPHRLPEPPQTLRTQTLSSSPKRVSAGPKPDENFEPNVRDDGDRPIKGRLRRLFGR